MKTKYYLYELEFCNISTNVNLKSISSKYSLLSTLNIQFSDSIFNDKTYRYGILVPVSVDRCFLQSDGDTIANHNYPTIKKFLHPVFVEDFYLCTQFSLFLNAIVVNHQKVSNSDAYIRPFNEMWSELWPFVLLHSKKDEILWEVMRDMVHWEMNFSNCCDHFLHKILEFNTKKIEKFVSSYKHAHKCEVHNSHSKSINDCGCQMFASICDELSPGDVVYIKNLAYVYHSVISKHEVLLNYVEIPAQILKFLGEIEEFLCLVLLSKNSTLDSGKWVLIPKMPIFKFPLNYFNIYMVNRLPHTLSYFYRLRKLYPLSIQLELPSGILHNLLCYSYVSSPLGSSYLVMGKSIIKLNCHLFSFLKVTTSNKKISDFNFTKEVIINIFEKIVDIKYCVIKGTSSLEDLNSCETISTNQYIKFIRSIVGAIFFFHGDSEFWNRKIGSYYYELLNNLTVYNNLETSMENDDNYNEVFAYKFKNPKLLYIALNAKTNKKWFKNLEYLGDAVINVVVSRIVTSRIPSKDSKIKFSMIDKFCTNEVLSLIASQFTREIVRDHNPTRHVDLERGLDRPYENLGKIIADRLFQYSGLLSDTFEAIAGAIFIDSMGTSEYFNVLRNVLEPILSSSIERVS